MSSQGHFADFNLSFRSEELVSLSTLSLFFVVPQQQDAVPVPVPDLIIDL